MQAEQRCDAVAALNKTYVQREAVHKAAAHVPLHDTELAHIEDALHSAGVTAPSSLLQQPASVQHPCDDASSLSELARQASLPVALTSSQANPPICRHLCQTVHEALELQCGHQVAGVVVAHSLLRRASQLDPSRQPVLQGQRQQHQHAKPLAAALLADPQSRQLFKTHRTRRKQQLVETRHVLANSIARRLHTMPIRARQLKRCMLGM